MRNSQEYAMHMDDTDPLRSFREEFIIPSGNDGEIIYLCGNSLGLQPKSVRAEINKELDKWGNHGVNGHFKSVDPWISYHLTLKKAMSAVVGAKDSEIAIMNTLTVNIHLLLVSFYNPVGKKKKIIVEKGLFPSDRYALFSHAKFRGIDPKKILIELTPRPGESTLRTDDIVKAIEENKEETALIFMGGVNYYTGQVFNLKSITNAGHKAGAIVGFDLAHAAGNVELNLHDDNIDFAVWCTYKYLNSGPGGIGAAYIHERHGNNHGLERLAGWWGVDISSRFLMENEFIPAAGAEGWALSTSPIMLMAPLRASLELFTNAGMKSITQKSILLTAFLENILNEIAGKWKDAGLEVITPKDRGAQLSIVFSQNGKIIFNNLIERGVLADWREPTVIRLAPVPLYNTFMEVFKTGQILTQVLENLFANEERA